jgi:hypothetical protein
MSSDNIVKGDAPKLIDLPNSNDESPPVIPQRASRKKARSSWRKTEEVRISDVKMVRGK